MYTAFIVACVFSGNVLLAPCTTSMSSHEGSTAVCAMMLDIGSKEDLAKDPKVMLRYTCAAGGYVERDGFLESPANARKGSQSGWRKAVLLEAIASQAPAGPGRKNLLAEAAAYRLGADYEQEAADTREQMATPRGDARNAVKARQEAEWRLRWLSR